MSAYDDERMKELVERLVAMSPEPPPYPEEVIMTVSNRRPRRNPALAFAGAAVIVLLAAGIPMLLSRNAEPGPATSLPPVADTTLAPGTTQPTPSTEGTTPTETTEPVVGTWEHTVYLMETPANSLMSNPALVAFATELPGSSTDDVALLAERSLSLLTNPDLILPDGFSNAIPEGVEVLSVEDSGQGYLIVDMNDLFVQGAGGLLADVTMLNQIVYTVTQYGPADRVLFTAEGAPIEAYGDVGIILTDTVGREDYLDQLNSIIITQPLILGGDGIPVAAGVANVFEATVSLQIVESESGEMVYEEFTTASCGTGCWGDFSFDLDVPELTPQRTVLVFFHSPKDGEPSDVVRIPVNPEGGWVFLPAAN